MSTDVYDLERLIADFITEPEEPPKHDLPEHKPTEPKVKDLEYPPKCFTEYGKEKACEKQPDKKPEESPKDEAPEHEPPQDPKKCYDYHGKEIECEKKPVPDEKPPVHDKCYDFHGKEIKCGETPKH
ncbi:uncharacterized protein M421DRAFT_165181 [Didymella exigua CBS 183.55]|uniref:Uncharacterized protein n=1 Tax=Didymella exigua CBS 183.55 TaxID=1150837 RepID=A0A6A5RKJ3_9PLEO|nr:uncharacterized protein M421DRAFT_165181 [Didymella exigua CBS 183.55]KAF1927973.1 hypothetical protein M421DRAFT_165181 [Didymella exigua CBS 183.55]